MLKYLWHFWALLQINLPSDSDLYIKFCLLEGSTFTFHSPGVCKFETQKSHLERSQHGSVLSHLHILSRVDTLLCLRKKKLGLTLSLDELEMCNGWLVFFEYVSLRKRTVRL